MGAKIAQLRHRITIQSLARTSDGQGGWTEVWTDFKTVWAQVLPKSASQRYFSQKIEQTTTHEITIRWMDGITQEMRIDFEGRKFQIHGVRRENEERWFLILDAEEGVGS